MIAQRAKTKPEILEGVSKEVESSKFVERNTLRVKYKDGSEAIRLHNTDVVTFLKDGKIVLSSGGYRTPTTKERINRYTDARVHQDKGIWYVGESSFYDGIIISKEGKILSKVKQPNMKIIEGRKKDIKNFVAKLTKDNLPIPSGGDCWLCSMKDESGKSWGEQRGNDNQHIHQHVKEGYLHGSLIVNAMKASGYNETQIGLHYQMKWVDHIKRALRKYLQKKLILDIAVK